LPKKIGLRVPNVDEKSIFEAKNSIKNMSPNSKGRTCKLNFPALHKSNFAAYFTGCQIRQTRKVDKNSVLEPKVDFESKKSILNIVFST